MSDQTFSRNIKVYFNKIILKNINIKQNINNVTHTAQDILLTLNNMFGFIVFIPIC